MGNPQRIYDRLANLNQNTVVNEAALADLLEVNPRTVRRMEENSHLPKHFKLGCNSCWIAGKVIEYFYFLAEKAQETERSDDLLSKYKP